MPRKVLLTLGATLILVSIALFLRDKFFVGEAGVLVQSEPEATVFIDGVQVGTTPYEVKMKPKEMSLRLIPFSQGEALATYQTQIKLTEGVTTVVRRIFGPTEDSSAGFVLSFEKMKRGEASVAVVSHPESAQIMFDGKLTNTTPYKIESVKAADHTLTLTAPGYLNGDVSIKTALGYLLTAFVKLAKLPDEEKKVEEEKLEQKRIVVEIQNTPTGFLRVRFDASTAASEVGRVTPGKKYPFQEEKEVGTMKWYKIEYETTGSSASSGKSGWISGEYAKKIEESL